MSKRYDSMYELLEKVKYAGMLLSGISIFIMMTYTCLDVLLRNLFNFGSLNTYEFSQNYFMPMAVFPALAYAYGRGIMPRIELLISRVRNSIQKTTAVVIYTVECLLFTLLAVYGFNYFTQSIIDSIAFSAGGANYPIWPVLVFLPISFLLIALESLFLLIKNIKNPETSFTVKNQEKLKEEKGMEAI
ncbi:TRAP transporter small permease [Alkalicoccus daliensis]|uniref:TRAP-type mannitol/chloroaromatic compound transport system, small permease component n=1 Tax=Alkalicoccus daliensis TaxID=745820 RepID=A0A1H0IZV0_9BACI|nr:TRAP transporter small permease [Alkalicoccus daliensis]SDO36862.1 TRAP-type mannitol/chloroaromatic compound transport system, small permease component [Alkalicoccus daliensis]